MLWLLVGGGGALGAIARHGLNQLIQQQHLASTFPLGIFVINVLGSALVGMLSGLIVSERWPLSLEARTFLIVGVLGGFTTFSSFSLDTLVLTRNGDIGQAMWNVAGQVGLSLFAVWLGFTIATL